MLKVKRHGIILRPGKEKFENQGVFNPACIKLGNEVHMYYRAFSKDKRSTIGYCKLDGPLNVVERSKKPILFSQSKKEYSLEDPRIVEINGIYYLTYVAYDGKNVRIAYAISKDPKNFKKKGIISPEMTYDRAEDIFRTCADKLKERYFLFEARYKDECGKNVILWDKDAFFFPKKIKGKFALVHRILPDIQVIYFKNFKDLTLKYWEKYFKRLSDYVILESRYWYENRNVGGGCPPIETDQGWLLIYHAVDDMNKGKIYRAGAALLDKDDPTKVIGHLKEPLFSPKEDYEIKGDVDNVVFPTGHAIFGKRLYIYYGAADKNIAVVSVNLKKLLKELLKNGNDKR
jgi:beta-1,2-mannobiose phosphorylase / 1,2-beta-oligomannan phosphorylase